MSEYQGAAYNRLRALVVEDEWPAREYLVELLVASNAVDVAAAVATSAEAHEVLGPNGLEIDVAFIDINLATPGGHEAGLDIVRDFAGKPGAPLFVFATALGQHAVKAFELDAVDYLLKPFSEERTRECLARVSRRRIRPRTPLPSRVAARSDSGLVFFRQSDVWAFEASERATFVHSANGRFEVDLSLAAIETTLRQNWLRAHRNWVVNLEHVRALERNELGSMLVLGGALDAGTSMVRCPVARDRLQSVRDALLDGTTGLRR